MRVLDWDMRLKILSTILTGIVAYWLWMELVSMPNTILTQQRSQRREVASDPVLFNYYFWEKKNSFRDRRMMKVMAEFYNLGKNLLQTRVLPETPS